MSATQAQATAPQAKGRKPGALTLPETLKLFLSYASPAILATILVGGLVGRLLLGSLSWIDAVVVAAVVAIYPFFEWCIHVFILHQPPRQIFGRTFQLFLAKKHYQHHAEPWDVPVLFVPWRTHLFSLAVIGLVLFLTPDAARPHVLTGVATLWALGLFYEWVHFVSHVPYRARTKYMRELQRLHRLHHFKSEQHWYGVATHVADRVLGTSPDPASVETSPTCRTLQG